MSDNKRSFKRIALIVLVSILVVLVCTFVFTFTPGADYPGGPPTRDPTEVVYLNQTREARTWSDEVTMDPTDVVHLNQTRQAHVLVSEPTLQAAWSTLVETTGFVSVTSLIDLEFDGKRLWIASFDEGVRAIDPVSLEVVVGPIKIRHPGTLAFDGQRIWVVESESDTMRPIDVNTGAVGSPVQVEGEVHDVVYDGTRLWVALTRDDTVQAIDPVAGRVSQPIRVGSQPSHLAVDRIHRRLWVANDHTVQAIDLDKGVPVGEPIAVVDVPKELAFAGTRLWVDYFGGIQAIDPITLEAGPFIPLKGQLCALAVDGTRLWFASCENNTIQALDTATGKLNEPIPLRSMPWALEFDGTRLWVGGSDQLQYLVPLK
jgi:YVTN family beta-propeller protein